MFFFNIANYYVKFNISLQKHSSPGTVILTNYKRRHISASGSAQTVAKPARLKPIGKSSLHTDTIAASIEISAKCSISDIIAIDGLFIWVCGLSCLYNI